MTAPADVVVRKLEMQLHDLMRERAGNLMAEHGLEPPALVGHAPTDANPCWFPVPGMHGGFRYWYESMEDPVRLMCDSWCRVVGGSEQHHEITIAGKRLIGDD